MGGSKSSGGDVEPTEDMVAQQQINAELWNHYVTNYKPMMDKWVEKATDENIQTEEKRKIAGKINAEVMKATTPEAAGTNPVTNARRLSDIATLEGKAQVTGQAKTRSKQLSDIQSVIDIGRGEATEAQEGLSSLASSSVAEAIADEQADQLERAATEDAVASGVGMGLAIATKSAGGKKKTPFPQVYKT